MGSKESKDNRMVQYIGSGIVILTSIFITQAIAYVSSEPMSFTNTLTRLGYFTIAVQWVVFIHAGGFFGNARTEKYYDLTGALTYLSTLALSTYYARNNFSARQISLTAFISIWTIRLGSFLFMRIHNNSGVDSRFTVIKQNNMRFLVAWTLQGVWVFLTLIPINILNQNGDNTSLNVFDFIGLPLWGIGFLFETIADMQKSYFRSKPENQSKWISSGLWSISRHPNYFGEITLWTGVALSSFGGLSYQDWRSYLVFISPLFTSFLLNFVSGIPLLENKSDKLYGDNEEYKKYKKRTPVLIPFIGMRGDFKFGKC